jgi:hypothetical protein
MTKIDTRKTPVRYAPNTPPPESGYPLMGKTSLVMADLLARAFGLEKPEFKMEPVTVEELCPKE